MRRYFGGCVGGAGPSTMATARTPAEAGAKLFHPTSKVNSMPAEQPQVILSAFADEAANQKTAVQQFAALAAIGLQYYSIRWMTPATALKT